MYVGFCFRSLFPFLPPAGLRPTPCVQVSVFDFVFNCSLAFVLKKKKSKTKKKNYDDEEEEAAAAATKRPSA